MRLPHRNVYTHMHNTSSYNITTPSVRRRLGGGASLGPLCAHTERPGADGNLEKRGGPNTQAQTGASDADEIGAEEFCHPCHRLLPGEI